MFLRHAEMTDIGLAREKNEDALWSEPFEPAAFQKKGALFVIADGLGGLPRGEVASRAAVEAVSGIFGSFKAKPPDDWLRAAFQKAHDTVEAMNRREEEGPMATTLTASWFWGDELRIAHVGDCRVYRVRGGEVRALTRDHSMSRHVLARTIGVGEFNPDLYKEEVRAGDAYVQASDGLYPLFSPPELGEIALLASPQDACRRFVQTANARGGPDNITVQVIRVE